MYGIPFLRLQPRPWWHLWMLASPVLLAAGAAAKPEIPTHIDAHPHEKTEPSNKQPEVLAKLRARLERLRKEAAPANILPNDAPADFQFPKVWGEPALTRNPISQPRNTPKHK